MKDMPMNDAVSTHIVEIPQPGGPYEAQGCGEATMIHGVKLTARLVACAAWLLAALVFFDTGTPGVTAAQPIKIGFSMPLTGGLAAQGKAALMSMELWREDVNTKGG